MPFHLGFAVSGQPDLGQILVGAGFGLGAGDTQHVHRCLHDVFQHGQVVPQVEVLEHHGQLAAHGLQLLVVHGLEHAVFGQRELQFLSGHADGARVGALQHVDAAQEGALARSAGADDADAVTRMCGQRDALEHFVLPVAFVNVGDVEFVAHVLWTPGGMDGMV